MASEPLSPDDQIAVAIVQQGLRDIQEYRASVNKTYLAYCAAIVTGKSPPEEYLLGDKPQTAPEKPAADKPAEVATT